MKEIKCEIETQLEKSIFLADRITMKQLRYASKLQAEAQAEMWDDAVFEKLYNCYASFVPRWTFVGEDGSPLEQPGDNPLILDELTPEEFMWLSTSVFESMQPSPPTG